MLVITLLHTELSTSILSIIQSDCIFCGMCTLESGAKTRHISSQRSTIILLLHSTTYVGFHSLEVKGHVNFNDKMRYEQ